ncbi:hypothetical protein FHU35_14422 [Saccharopolyspora dendranthemae]|uniref:Tetratricopeptide repeat protein n=1 Tax=Saccharopolyspora dendranthemae TaxID=1181886 RepID=A0A561U460_9PSEU|nr:hypothetical protein FHU35_14422 [Saccharopolyspora dendranthemae]
MFVVARAKVFGVDARDLHGVRAADAVGDAVEAIRRGSRVVISDPGRPERVAHHHVDQARAWVLEGDRERALGELNAARDVSPSQVRGHPSVRETAWSLLRQPRVSAGAVEFARWVGLKPN